MQKLGYFFLKRCESFCDSFLQLYKKKLSLRTLLPQSSPLPSLFLAIACSIDVISLDIKNVSQIW